ncbi:hypothetical protein B0H14DRAFT_3874084 [Mycena olivaceomarginata]|nr:hypothetical protein B0H14DRAFT_3874084 [Mycena olivaceomarginata]
MKFTIVFSALLSAVTAVSGLAITESNIVSRYAAYGAEHVDLVARLCARVDGKSVGTASDEAADAAAGVDLGFSPETIAPASFPNWTPKMYLTACKSSFLFATLPFPRMPLFTTSSRASSPTSDEDFRGVMDAMGEVSPAPPQALVPQKRSHGAMLSQDETSDNEQPASTEPTATVNQNTVIAAHRFGEKNRLRVEQLTMLDIFMNDPPALREGKLFALLLAFGNQIEKIVGSAPAYEVSADLLTNVKKYAPVVLLSSQIRVYKGDAATEILLALLKKYRFDIPPGLENIPAVWAKVVVVSQEALTQTRAKLKKLIRWSLVISKNDTEYAPPEKQQNIFQLTSAICKGTQCSVDVVRCARVALMRRVFLKSPGTDFWDKLDKRLVKIRQQAEGDSVKLSRAFRQILTDDQNTHGVNDYKITEKVADEFQQQVDDIIDIRTIDAATCAQVIDAVEGDAA